MNITVSFNLWFMVSLCLLCMLAGMIYGVAASGRRDQNRYCY
jgi:hypothetical protein